MGAKLEKLDGDAWQEFTQAPLAVLMLGKSDCAACNDWTRELEALLMTDGRFDDVRFGKILLDQRGLVSFKKANPWIADLHELPYNLIYVNGARVKSWAGAVAIASSPAWSAHAAEATTSPFVATAA